ncbi:mycothiol system anti-sigma-R factor [Mycobacterium sp. MYCO198283]|uniref:mycothiol system anti-sigma-R factor n=1 Tax=Mycobacterium sp. MYCO198283 TaxID=2883505 RepID=UPI001E2D397A|nr:mycothiol system anti-sigma-R factor [Mycobacterium sp. MYCO198283]MCG5431592.1 mycothiol system anti-sigma-R factor [Mycobacterium sp. MYCO198283]
MSDEIRDEKDCAPRPQVDPEHPDCAAVLAEVWTLLDGECTPETRDQLRHHLEECPACLRHYGLEERLKKLIATKCSGERAPDGLRQRLMLEISRTTIVGRG